MIGWVYRKYLHEDESANIYLLFSSSFSMSVLTAEWKIILLPDKDITSANGSAISGILALEGVSWMKCFRLGTFAGVANCFLQFLSMEIVIPWLSQNTCIFTFDWLHCIAIFFFSDIVNERIVELLDGCIQGIFKQRKHKPSDLHAEDAVYRNLTSR